MASARQKVSHIIAHSYRKVLWRIVPLLSSDSVNSGRCYVTPATYTHAAIEEVVRAPTVAIQRRGKHLYTNRRACLFCIVRAEQLSWRQLALLTESGKRQTRSLVRESVPHQQACNCLKVIKIWS
jgi:hypothetical protein